MTMIIIIIIIISYSLLLQEKNPFLLEDYKPPKVWKHLIMLGMVGEDEVKVGHRYILESV